MSPLPLDQLVRPNILALKPYSSARDEFTEAQPDTVFLDANENSLGGPLDEDFSRYPDPRPQRFRQALAREKNVAPEQIFLGNGSDEAIDLLLRAFCAPGLDNVIILPPTYGMYAVQAAIHGTEIRRVPLRPDFTPDAAAVLAAADERSKLLFLCSPNNPTGQRLPDAFVRDMLTHFPGLVVVDEAYADFAQPASLTGWLADFPNLVVLQTFSKAWGLAGLRLGMAFANVFIINILNKIKYPYNLNTLTIRLAEQALERAAVMREKVAALLAERDRLAAELAQISTVLKVWPSDANFLLVQTADADALYHHLSAKGIIVRNRSREMHCENCLRITVGTLAENDRLLAQLRQFPLTANH